MENIFINVNLEMGSDNIMKRVYMIDCEELVSPEIYYTLSRRDELIEKYGIETWRRGYKDICNIVRDILGINNLLSLSIKKEECRKENEYDILVIIFDITADEVDSSKYFKLQKEFIDDENFKCYIEIDEDE